MSDGAELIKNYDCQYDILLRDIQMEELDGMKAASIIRETDDKVIIIFITNLAQLAIQGYMVNAFGFIVKPISYFSFCDKIMQASEQLARKRPKFLQLQTGAGLIYLEYTTIIMVETLNRKLTIDTLRGKYSCSQTLQSIEEQLGDERFFRCHNAFLVNLQFVEDIGRAIAIVAGREVPISRHRRKDLINALINYM